MHLGQLRGRLTEHIELVGKGRIAIVVPFSLERSTYVPQLATSVQAMGFRRRDDDDLSLQALCNVMWRPTEQKEGRRGKRQDALPSRSVTNNKTNNGTNASKKHTQCKCKCKGREESVEEEETLWSPSVL
jgi:hypothetical protein